MPFRFTSALFVFHNFRFALDCFASFVGSGMSLRRGTDSVFLSSPCCRSPLISLNCPSQMALYYLFAARTFQRNDQTLLSLEFNFLFICINFEHHESLLDICVDFVVLIFPAFVALPFYFSAASRPVFPALRCSFSSLRPS